MLKVKELSSRIPITTEVRGIKIAAEVEKKKPLDTFMKQVHVEKLSDSVVKVDEIVEQERTSISWLDNNSNINPYKYEFIALCIYLKSRESGRYKFKFTESTILKNIINKGATLSKTKFKGLVSLLAKIGIVKKIASSFTLTKRGQDLYWMVKKENYSI